MITNFYLIESKVTAGDKFDTTISKDIINEIIEKVKKNNYIPPTQEWLSGVLVNARYPYKSDRTAVRKLYAFDNLKTDEERAKFREHFTVAQEKNARNIKSVFDTLAKYKLVTPVLDAKKQISEYDFPDNNRPGHPDGAKRDKISKLRDKIRPILQQHYRSLLKKTKDDLSEQEYEAAGQYIENLPENLQQAFAVFQQMDSKELNYMKHLIKVRDAAKKDGYTNKVMDKLADEKTADRLNALGVISETGVLNLKLTNDIMELISDKNFVFSSSPIAIDFYQTLKRLSSAGQYQQNALSKRLAGSVTSLDASAFVDTMSPEQKIDLMKLFVNVNSPTKVLVKPSSLEAFKSNGLLDKDGKFTDKGQAVAGIIKNGGDGKGGGSLGNNNKAVDAIKGRPVDKIMSNSPPIRDADAYDKIQDRKQIRNANIADLGSKVANQPNQIGGDRSDSTTKPTTREVRDRFIEYRNKLRGGSQE